MYGSQKGVPQQSSQELVRTLSRANTAGNRGEDLPDVACTKSGQLMAN